MGNGAPLRIVQLQARGIRWTSKLKQSCHHQKGNAFQERMECGSLLPLYGVVSEKVFTAKMV
jgi:hypothetical protein